MNSTGRNGNGNGNGRRPVADPGDEPPGLRLPPQNAEAEQRVLGAMLLDRTAAHEVLAVLKAEDFYRDQHRLIFAAIRDLADIGAPLDVLSVAEQLASRGELSRAGGQDRLMELHINTPHAANATYHAAIVREKAIKRAVLEAANAVLLEAYRDQLTAEELVAEAEQRIFAAAETSLQGSAAPAAELVDESLREFQRREGGHCSGIPCGFSDLDQITDGLPDGGLAILAARPAMGKTAFAVNVCEYAAYTLGVPTLLFSLEMAGREQADRLIVSRARIDGHKYRTARGLRPEDHRAICEAHESLRAGNRLWIDATATRTVGQIAAAARRHQARHGLRLVVIDYLQLIESGPESAARSSRQEQVSAISRRLKCLAGELACPVLALSQLNRQSETREDRRPRMADLRESGALEQDADLVMLLHRPEEYDRNDRPGEADLIIAKNRHGRTGVIRLAYRKEQLRFHDLAPQEPTHAPIDPDDPAF